MEIRYSFCITNALFASLGINTNVQSFSYNFYPNRYGPLVSSKKRRSLIVKSRWALDASRTLLHGGAAIYPVIRVQMLVNR
jgi:hypothetical protein